MSALLVFGVQVWSDDDTPLNADGNFCNSHVWGMLIFVHMQE